MGVTSEAISTAIIVGLVRSNAITTDQLGSIVDELVQAAASVKPNLPGSAAKIERFIDTLHHQLRLDLPERPKQA